LIVLDASLMAAWLLGERGQPAIHETYVELRSEPVVVPAHWPVEISNTLRTHLRAGRLSIADFHEVIDELDAVGVHVDQPIDLDEIGPLAQFAMTYNLTAYDAAYVQLAIQHGATLATLDAAMRSAATSLNIPLLPAATP
jgi:predicted nucleic acid-binding protein